MSHTFMGWKLTNTYKQLPAKFYTYQPAAIVKQTSLLIYNKELAKQLHIEQQFFSHPSASAFLAGQLEEHYPESMALAYAGHQFGYFNRLGDGRALLLGEQHNYDIQLKGSGRTAYSRNGDGKAALGPMLREYIISEAMHGLRIATTRSLSVVSTGEAIVREKYLPGAILCRVAASHLRVGTFEYSAAFGTKDDIQALADYAIRRHYPHLENEQNRYSNLIKEVAKKQGKLIASWELVGFIHGVMNTDNMTISGETIDYGPCAFMNVYNPDTVYSSIDTNGRYAYSNQAQIGNWNVSKLAEALLPILHEDDAVAVELAKEALGEYAKSWRESYFEGMRAKLGLGLQEEGDESLILELLQFMYDEQLDYTNTFVDLTLHNFIRIDCYQSEKFHSWKLKWEQRLKLEKDDFQSIQQKMMNVNPIVIARNDWVEAVLSDAEKHNSAEKAENLLTILKNPFAYTEQQRLMYIEPIQEKANYQTYCGT